MSETQTTPAAGKDTNVGAEKPAPTIVSQAEKIVEKELLYFGKRVHIGSRKVKVVRIKHFNLIPETKEAKSIRDEVTLKIGSQWKVGTRDIIRGLTQEEERRFLPTILGVNVNSEKWEEKALLHWADFSIQVPNNDIGIELEAGYKVVNLANGDKEIIPIHLDDYMKYHFCVENGKVANEGQENPVLHDFKLVDLAKEQIEKEKQFEAKKKVEGRYLALIKSTDPKERIKIDWILETAAGEDSRGISIVGLSEMQKEMELEKFKNTNIEGFVKAISDPDLQDKSLIRKAVQVGKLSYEGDTYSYGNKALGDIDKAIQYFKNPNNALDRQMIELAVNNA